MKQTILSFLLALLPIMASADAVEIDGVYYNLITKAKQAEVTYGPNRYAGEIVIPNVILYNNIEYDVTTIRSFTFSNCFDLTSVTIPNTLKSIEGMCFNGCEGLTSVYIMDIESWLNMKFQDNPLTYASHLYVNGEEIENLIIPNNLTTINDRVFSGWKGLVSLTIPSSVTSIGEASFAGCSGLTSVIIPNSVITIGRNAFSRCSALTSITIPNSVISIGGNEQYSDGGAFSNCSSLMSVTFSNNLNKIYAETFKDCI